MKKPAFLPIFHQLLWMTPLPIIILSALLIIVTSVLASVLFVFYLPGPFIVLLLLNHTGKLLVPTPELHHHLHAKTQ